jgi:outer membrane lipoprotein carrier protein
LGYAFLSDSAALAIHRLQTLAILLLLLGLASAPLLAQNDTAILRKVDDHYNHLTSLRTHYREHYTGMGMDRAEEGTLLLKKPGRMRWSYAEPAGKLFVLDGKFAWFYTPGDSQAQRVPAKQLDDLRSPLRLLLGHTQLGKELEHITITPLAEQAGTNYRISGIPKGMSQRLKLLTLIVTPNGSIQQMRLEEVDGAVTDFAFSDMQENVPVKDTEFTFTLPPGVTIVEGLSPI